MIWIMLICSKENLRSYYVVALRIRWETKHKTGLEQVHGKIQLQELI